MGDNLPKLIFSDPPGCAVPGQPAIGIQDNRPPATKLSPRSIHYIVTRKNIYGPRAAGSVLINVQQPFKPRTAAGDTLCKGNIYPKAKPGFATLYKVAGKDRHNCFTNTGYAPVAACPYPLVEAGRNQALNAFSTNGDGVKHVFYPGGKG